MSRKPRPLHEPRIDPASSTLDAALSVAVDHDAQPGEDPLVPLVAWLRSVARERREQGRSAAAPAPAKRPGRRRRRRQP